MPEYKVPVTATFEWQQAVEDKDLVTPPGSPAKGVRYIVGGTGGAWSGNLGDIATYNGAGWDFTIKREGMICYVKDEDKFYLYIAAWADASILKANVASPVFTGDVTAPSLGETTPGSVRGTNKEIFKTADADSPLTATQCSGTIVSNYGMTDADCTIDLPTAVEGLSFVCILPAVRARFFKLHCPTAQADKIYLLGVAGSSWDDGNVGVASGYVTGVAASFFTFKASDGGYDWFCIPIFGTWVAS